MVLIKNKKCIVSFLTVLPVEYPAERDGIEESHRAGHDPGCQISMKFLRGVLYSVSEGDGGQGVTNAHRQAEQSVDAQIKLRR